MAWASNRLNPTLPRSDLYYEIRTSGAWSAMVSLTSTFDNNAPNLLQLGNGTILLFWSSNPTGSYSIYYLSYNARGWSNRVQVTSGFNDSSPSTTIDGAGTLWLFWMRVGASCGISPCRQLFYKTLNNGVWSADVQLTTDPTYNITPSAMVAKDGRLWVAYQKWLPVAQTYQLFYRIYNGTFWGPDVQLTLKNIWDERPSIIQDRNGTIWVFWDRDIQITSTMFESDIYSKFSVDNGVTWSADTQMTFDPSCCLIDDVTPSAVQGADRSIWLFYSSDLTGFGADYDIYYMTSSLISPVHDVGVTSVQASPSMLYPGGLLSIGQSPIVKVVVTVADLGDFSETVTVIVTAVNATTYKIGNATGTVAPGTAITLPVYWNTTSSVKPGRYGFSVLAQPVPGETVGNSGDNIMVVKNSVQVLPLGDVDQDGNVNIVDFSVVAFGYLATPGNPRWNPYADINGDGIIDINDVSVVAKNYGIVT